MVHVKPKRPLQPVPFLQNTINELVQASSSEHLTRVLDSFDAPFHFERPEERNLINWYSVLNRFDELLDRYVDSRNIFSPATTAASSPGAGSNAVAANATTNAPSAFDSPAVSSAANPSTAPAHPSAHPSVAARAPAASAAATTVPATAAATGTVTDDATAAAASAPTAGRIFTPTPHVVLLILRFTHRLVRNSSHDTRHVFNSVEHLGALLADPNSAIVLLSIEILNLLLQRTSKFRSIRVGMTVELSERLADLAAGLGGRENGLGLLDCCSSKSTATLSRDGARVNFEYTRCVATVQQQQQQQQQVQQQQHQHQTPANTGADRRGSSGEVAPNTTQDEVNPQAPASASQQAAHHAASAVAALVAPHGGHGRKLSSDPTASRHSGPIPLPPVAANALSPPTILPTFTVQRGQGTITIADAGQFDADERWLLLDYAHRCAVPKGRRFSLLAALRRARSFSLGRDARVEAAVIRLSAITALFQLQHMQSIAQDQLTKEPELLQDIVALARADGADGVGDIPRCLRNIAIRCITAMASDRQRASSIMNVTGVNQLHGALPTLLRTEVSALMDAKPSNTPEPSAMDVSTDTPESRPGDPSADHDPNAPLSLMMEYDCRVPKLTQSILTTEAILSLVHGLAISTGSSGATPLANSGVLGILIPLLSDTDPQHARVVSQAIRTMQSIVEVPVQTIGCQIFRDQDGLTLVSNRICAEIGVGDEDMTDEGNEEMDEAVEIAALDRRGESRELYDRLSKRQMTLVEAIETQPPSSFATFRGHLSHSKWSLLRALHQLLLAALGSGGNEVRELVVNSQLPRALRKVLAQPFHHGGCLFQAAATVTTDIAHAEPTATAELVKAGIAKAVLRTIKLGLPPCGEAVRCIPNLLAALCLASAAKDVIVKSSPLEPYLLRLATPFYTRALHGEIPIHIGNAVDELMRHVEALRPDGNKATLEYLRMSMTFVTADVTKLPTTGIRRSVPNSNTKSVIIQYSSKSDRSADKLAETATEGSKPIVGDGQSRPPDVVLVHKMKLAVANNSSRLAGFSQGSSENQDAIASGHGLKYMVALRLAPALACAEATVKDTGSYSRHYPTPSTAVVSLSTCLRNLSSRHGGAVFKELFSSILQDASKALKIADQLDNKWLPQEDGLDGASKPDQLADNIIPDGSSTTGDKTEKKTDDGKPLTKDRTQLRSEMADAIASLRVGVVLLSALSRGGLGSSAGAWENSGGSQFAAVIAAVERAARCHLAKVYTGLTLSAASDGDLSTAKVTAATDPKPKALSHQDVTRHLGDVDRYLGYQITKSKAFEEACKSQKVPQGGAEQVRQDVKGLAWHLVTFAVAAQRLYSTLSRGLSLSFRRHSSRDLSRYAASARSLAATIGRIFALHLKAAAPLWDEKVLTMGNSQVTAAWDYVRGILIEMKGTLFDEQRATTQVLVLRSFLEAGGAEALLDATRPALLLKSASSLQDNPGDRVSGDERAHIDECLQQDSLAACGFLVAVGEAYDEKFLTRSSSRSEAGPDGKPDDAMSIDSVSNQARGISRIVVSEAEVISRDSPSSEEPFRKLVTNKNYLASLKAQIEATSKIALEFSFDVAVRRVASDAWSTICRFLYLLAACPGLINPNLTAGNGFSTNPGDWGQRDVPRSAQTLVMDILQEVIKHPEHLLAVYNPDWSAVTDIMGIAQATANTYRVLSQSNSRPEATPGNFEHWEDLVDAREPTPSRPLSPDPNLVQSLVEMGFPEQRAITALRSTAGGIEYAMEWLLSHAEEEERSDGSDADARRNGEQGVGSGGGSGGGNGDSNEAAEDGVDAANDDGGDDVEVDGDDEEEDEVADEQLEEDDDDDNDDEEQEEADGNEMLNEDSDMEEDEDNQDDDDEDDEGIEDEVMGQDRAMSDGPELTSGSAANSRITRSRVLNSFFLHGNSSASKHDTATKGQTPKAPVTTLSLQTDGKTLLDLSISTELELLTEALRRDPILSSFDVPAICKTVALHIGATYKATDDKKTKERKGSTIVNPTSVDVFKSSKKELFESLSKLTIVVITEADKFPHEAHLPYVAIDLLGILQKGRETSSDGDREFARLLFDGLHLLLKTDKSTSGELPDPKGQATSMWAHFGGQRARHVLNEVGVFTLASSFLENIVEDWERDLNAPLDKEATGSIEKLRISDRAGNRRLSRYMQEEATGEGGSLSRSRSGKIRLLVPTEHDVLKLGQICTCALALDAHVRYADKDRTIVRAEKLYGSEKSDGKKGNNEKKNRMETDDTGFDSDEVFPRETLGNAIAAAESAAAAYNNRENNGRKEGQKDKGNDNDNVKDMEVDTKTIEEMEDGLEVLKAEAAAERETIIRNALTEVADVTDRPCTTDKEVETDARVKLLKLCIRLLKILKNLEAGDALLALLQLLTSLTREWRVSEIALEEGLVELLLGLAHLEGRLARSVNSHIVRTLTKTILRHLVEDPQTLKEAMVVEMRGVVSSGPTRTRTTFPLKNLVGSTAPLAARDLGCFVKAMAETVTSAGERSGHIELRAHKAMTMEEARKELEKRTNVTRVVGALCALLLGRPGPSNGNSEGSGSGMRGHGSRRGDHGQEMQKYALESLGELVEVSQMVAVSFMNTRSPSSAVGGSAADFVVQTLMPSVIESVDARGMLKENSDVVGVSEGARKLFSSLCSRNAMVHEAAVGALAKAVTMESNKAKASAGLIEGAAFCLSHGGKTRVLRAALKTDIGNDLARSMQKLDVDGNEAAMVKGHVLRALSTLGHAATQVGRGGDGVGEDVYIGGGRDGWNSLRDRDLPVNVVV